MAVTKTRGRKGKRKNAERPSASTPGPRSNVILVRKLGKKMCHMLHEAVLAHPSDYLVTGMDHGTDLARSLYKRGLVQLFGFDQPDTVGERYIKIPNSILGALSRGEVKIPALERYLKNEHQITLETLLTAALSRSAEAENVTDK